MHPGWWGFVFPLAAMTLSILGVGAAVDSTVILVVSVVATAVLLAVWLVVGVRTAGLLRTHAVVPTNGAR